MTAEGHEVTASDRSGPGPGGGAVELPLRRNRFSTPALVVAGLALVAFPVAVAAVMAATVVTSATTVGGVLIGMVVPLALFAFAYGVARPLVAGRRTVLVLRGDALVLADRTLFRSPEAISRHVVARAWMGEGVDDWLASLGPDGQVALAPDDEPVDLLLAFEDLVVFDHARTKVSRPKGEHRSSLPHPARPAGHLWVPLADPAGARAALDAWLPEPVRDAPAGAPPPPLP